MVYVTGMKFIPRSLLIVVKAHNAEAMREAKEAAVWLRERGITSRLVPSAAAASSSALIAAACAAASKVCNHVVHFAAFHCQTAIQSGIDIQTVSFQRPVDEVYTAECGGRGCVRASLLSGPRLNVW